MPAFSPFPGVRYAPEVDLDSVVAPPYDVVGPEERAALVARSPHNCIRVELPVEEDGTDRFTVAERLWSQWRQEGVLRRDADHFYVLRMAFTDHRGGQHSSTGVLGALALGRTGDGQILPHEQTTPKPKGERLSLQRHCRANISPIWGLSLTRGLSELLAPGGEPDGDKLGHTVDPGGVIYDLWALPSEREAAVAAAVAAAPVVLADGHHRYETALNYRDEVRATEGAAGAAEAVLALVTELSEQELSVQAIHRVLVGVEGEEVRAAFAERFELKPYHGTQQEVLQGMASAGAIGLVLSDGLWLGRPLAADATDEDELPIDSARIQPVLDQLQPADLVYQHGLDHVLAAVGEGPQRSGVLLRPATVADIGQVARSGRRMPPKTTYFYPKPKTGLVFRSLD
jgi:uncharacterized protein (DUF1015 family)